MLRYRELVASVILAADDCLITRRDSVDVFRSNIHHIKKIKHYLAMLIRYYARTLYARTYSIHVIEEDVYNTHNNRLVRAFPMRTCNHHRITLYYYTILIMYSNLRYTVHT